VVEHPKHMCLGDPTGIQWRGIEIRFGKKRNFGSLNACALAASY